MKNRTKNFLVLGGVISTLIGAFWTIPFVLEEKYLLVAVFSILIIIGLILLAIALGE